MKELVSLQEIYRIATVLLLIVATVVSGLSAGEEEEWTEPQTIAITQDDWTGIAMARDSDSNIHVACTDNDWVWYVKHDWWGQRLGEPIQVAGSAMDCRHVSLALDSQNNVHMVWNDQRSGQNEIYYSKVSHEGERLVTAKLISDEVETPSFMPDLAVDAWDDLHLAWAVEKYQGIGIVVSYEDIYYQKLDNDGNKLGQLIQVTGTTYPTEIPQRDEPCVSVSSGGEIFLSWRDSRDEIVFTDTTNYPEYEIYFCKLDDQGNKILQNTRLTDNEDNYQFLDMTIDARDQIHMAARGDTYDGVLWYFKLAEDGHVLENRNDISVYDDRTYDPAITIINDNCPVIFYHAYENGNTSFLHSMLDGNGKQLVRDELLWKIPDDGETQDIYACSDNRCLYVIWSCSETFDNEEEETRGFYMTNHQETPVVEENKETSDRVELPEFKLLYFAMALVLITVGKESFKKLRRRGGVE